MKTITLYEPAMCCSTGVCGPSVDQNLLTITAIFEALQQVDQVDAKRYNLSGNPDEFANNKTAVAAIQQGGDQVLPITMVDGEIVKTGSYPTQDELSAYTGLVFVREGATKQGGCCGGSQCC